MAFVCEIHLKKNIITNFLEIWKSWFSKFFFLRVTYALSQLKKKLTLAYDALSLHWKFWQKISIRNRLWKNNHSNSFFPLSQFRTVKMSEKIYSPRSSLNSLGIPIVSHSWILHNFILFLFFFFSFYFLVTFPRS